MDIKGNVFNIQRCSLHDGPGIRTTVFVKGCPLKCAWCQNPEGIAVKPSYSFDIRKCVSCGNCKSASEPAEAAELCPSGARVVFGKSYEPEELGGILMQDKDFFAEDGGVTFSGGECLLQADFVLACEKILKESGIKTAIDTCGCVPFSAIEKVIPYTDLFLYDIKHVDDEKHLAFTGQKTALILENFKKLYDTGAKIWVRVPIVGTFNATIQEAEKIKAFLNQFPNIEKIEALKYHKLGLHKYEVLSLSYSLDERAEVDSELFARIREILEGIG